jgi:hypothetical protein
VGGATRVGVLNRRRVQRTSVSQLAPGILGWPHSSEDAVARPASFHVGVGRAPKSWAGSSWHRARGEPPAGAADGGGTVGVGVQLLLAYHAGTEEACDIPRNATSNWPPR